MNLNADHPTKYSMTKFLRIKSLVIVSLFSFFLPTNQIMAETELERTAREMAAGSPITSAQKIFDILAKIAQWAYTIFFIMAIIFILVAAFNFLTAQGDPEKIKSARTQIIWACVAIAIALISVAAAQIIYNFIETA